MPVRTLPGGVPEPEELFGRDRTIQTIWENLAGNNVLLVAPRRFGKTGIMNHLLKRPRSGYVTVYLEVEDISDPEEFCSSLIAETLKQSKLRIALHGAKGVPQKLVDFISKHINKVKTDVFEVELKDAIGSSWSSITRTLITELEKADETVLFIFDEFPQLIENIAKKHEEETARTFLQWFRSLRMRQKDVLRRHRFVIGGSTGIDLTLRRLDVPDKLNDFARVPVEALTSEHADALLDALSNAYDLRFTPEGRAKFFELIWPPVPYFVHIFVSQIRIEEKLRRKELDARDIDDVYRRRVLGPTCRAYFDYYRDRLKRYGDPSRRAALAVLQEVAHAPAARVSNSTLYGVYQKARGRGATNFEFDEIMADLESDWYLVLDTKTNEHAFLLNIMRDWWKRFYRTLDKRTSE